MLLALIGLHVAAIIFYRLRQAQNLVGPMITGTGRARSRTSSRCGRANGGWRSLCLAAAFAVTRWVVAGAPPFGALDRGPPRDHIALMLIRHRTDAQPGDPQVPARPHRDGGWQRATSPTPKPAEASPLAAALFATGMVEGVFFGRDFISVTAAPTRRLGRARARSASASCSTISSAARRLFAPGTAAGIEIADDADVRGRPGRRRHHRPDQGIDRNPGPPGGRAGRRRHRLSRLQGRHALPRHAGRLLGLPVVGGHAEARDREPDQALCPRGRDGRSGLTLRVTISLAPPAGLWPIESTGHADDPRDRHVDRRLHRRPVRRRRRRCVAQRDEVIGRGHAERLVPMIDELLDGRMCRLASWSASGPAASPASASGSPPRTAWRSAGTPSSRGMSSLALARRRRAERRARSRRRCGRPWRTVRPAVRRRPLSAVTPAAQPAAGRRRRATFRRELVVGSGRRGAGRGARLGRGDRSLADAPPTRCALPEALRSLDPSRSMPARPTPSAREAA